MAKEETETLIPLTDFYCPKCGEMGVVTPFVISPGEKKIECDECKTKWNIDIQYKEAEE